MLIGAYECDFKQFPEDLIEELEEASILQATSVLCENAHKTINSAASSSANGAISREQKWHALLASPLLEEQELFYSEPTPDHKEQALGKKIDPKVMFESQKSEFSLGEHRLKDLVDNSAKLNFPGPTQYFQIGAATHALEINGFNPTLWKRNWLALLAQPGTLIYHQSSGYAQSIGKFL